MGCTLDQPIEPQEEAKEDIATQEDKNIAESIGQNIMELYRQVIKFEKDRIEITGKNKEEQEYMKRKIVMADDDIKFREKQLALVQGCDAEDINKEIISKTERRNANQKELDEKRHELNELLRIRRTMFQNLLEGSVKALKKKPGTTDDEETPGDYGDVGQKRLHKEISTEDHEKQTEENTKLQALVD